MLKLGLAYLPEDRDAQGLILPESIADNVTLPIVGHLARLGVLNRSNERRIATDATATYDVKATSIEQAVSSLSGGNRQKVAIRKMARHETGGFNSRRTDPRSGYRQQGADSSNHHESRRCGFGGSANLVGLAGITCDERQNSGDR